MLSDDTILTLRRKYYPLEDSSDSYTTDVLRKNVAASFKGLNSLHTWLIIPLLGLAIPRMTGLMDPDHFTTVAALFNYLLFIGIAQVIYKGNMFFLHTIRLRFDDFKMPYRKIVIIYFMVNIVYSGIVSLASLSTWNLYIAKGTPFEKTVIISTLVIIICVLFISNLYEIYYLRTEKEASFEKMELLEKAKLQLELEALNSQLDPHFLYNALTSLSYLIQQKPGEADQHNARLASLYQYVIQNKCSHFVSLDKELEFCRAYFSIQQLRFGDTVLLQIVPGDQNLQGMKVPPLSVQTLVENALKHNRFSAQEPLLVQVHINKENVQVTNLVQPAPYAEKGTGTGLNNLNQRLLLLTRQALKIERSSQQFSVSIPIVSA